MTLLPMANSCPKDVEIGQIRKIILEKNLVGLCNDTKWNELITHFRNNEWFVGNRSKWVSGYISEWENDWYYRLPFPFIGVEWLDIDFIKPNFKTHSGSTKAEPIILKEQIINTLSDIGFEFQVNDNFVRVWGYGPKCYRQFASNDA